MNYQDVERHGGNLNTRCLVKEGNMKRLHICILPIMLYFGKKQNYGGGKKIIGC